MSTSNTTSNISTCLWFPGNAEDAAKFYVDLFNNAPKPSTGSRPSSEITHISHYTSVGQEQHKSPVGSVMTVSFTLGGFKIMALNGPPIWDHSGAMSLMVECYSQDEVDWFYEALSTGGEKAKKMPCGWCADRFGVHWQVVPHIIREVSTSGQLHD